MADYYLAEQNGWMLYVEASSDLAIMRRLVLRLEHPAREFLSDSVPVFYLGNNKPQKARDHSQVLRGAKSNLAWIALFDRLEKKLHSGSALTECMWSRREIENYITTPTSLRAYVQ